jgi:hypothetical protein
MDKFFQYAEGIISAASKNPLAMIALVILVLFFLAFSFFAQASEITKLIIFLIVIAVLISFIYIIIARLTSQPQPNQSTNVNRATFIVQVTPIAFGELGVIVHVYIDDDLAGEISNIGLMNLSNQIDVSDLTAGSHRYKLIVDKFVFNQMGQPFSMIGPMRQEIGIGNIKIRNGDRFNVVGGYGNPPTLSKY